MIMNSCGNSNEQKVTLAEVKDQVTDTVSRKSLGAHALTLPQPVLIIGTYDENGIPNAMNVAWGGQCGGQQIELNLAISGRKTIDNLKLREPSRLHSPPWTPKLLPITWASFPARRIRTRWRSPDFTQ